MLMDSLNVTGLINVMITVIINYLSGNNININNSLSGYISYKSNYSFFPHDNCYSNGNVNKKKHIMVINMITIWLMPISIELKLMQIMFTVFGIELNINICN